MVIVQQPDEGAACLAGDVAVHPLVVAEPPGQLVLGELVVAGAVVGHHEHQRPNDWLGLVTNARLENNNKNKNYQIGAVLQIGVEKR